MSPESDRERSGGSVPHWTDETIAVNRVEGDPALREGKILDAVVTLVDSLLDDFDTVELLTELTERCTQLLRIASAGLLLADPTRQLHLIAATSDSPSDLEIFQLQREEGPCLECYSSGQPVKAADLRAQQHRWPNFAPAAIEAGFVAVHAVPMRAAGMVLGSLGLFGTSPGELSSADLALGQTLAHVATVAILQDHGPTQDAILPHLQRTLGRRVTVEQAKGFVRVRLDTTVEESFALLRRFAREQNRHLSEVAYTLIHDREARPGLLGELERLRSVH